ncbi:hypothetical protein WA026_017934 [Henosepilachna vigintioctopunctata]|uniref:TIL domain-containing protein n=1 Tax=Henosepilachna vigintioctopunctata TaxID=420089 RepID=A0AAW1TXB0_9CUCU
MLVNVVCILSIICVLVSTYSIPKICRRNEEWVEKINLCPPTCQSENPKCVINSLIHPPGCQCLPGYKYLSDDSRVCVKSSDCPAKCEQRHTEWNHCGSKCPITCEHPYERGCFLVCVQGCFCKKGYVLDETKNECVLLEHCPKKSNTTCDD